MIVNPNDTNHVVKITPRFYPTNTLDLKIKNSFKQTIDIVPVTYVFTNDNKLQLSFDYTFSDESSYSIAINDSITEEMVFRGLILATTQTTQDYSLTAAKYNWK